MGKLFLLMLALVCAQRARAQDPSKEEPPPQNTEDRSTLTDHGDEPEEGGHRSAENVGDAPVKMSMADVRMNFATVIETYLAKKSPEGYWELPDEKTGKTLKLRLASIDKNSIAPAEQPDHYVGRAILRDSSGKHEVPVDFTVDLAGQEWAVASYQIIGAAVKKAANDETGAALDAGSAQEPDFTQAVKSYVAGASNKGSFPFKDPATKKTWRLKLAKIHPPAVASDGEMRARVDFKLGKRTIQLEFRGAKKDEGWVVEKVSLRPTR